MNKRARLTLICALTSVGACSTTTPIGEVEAAGTSGQTPTGGQPPSTTSGSAGQSAATGPYVPSAGEALNETPFVNPSGVSGDWVGYLENYNGHFTGADVLRFHFGVDAQGKGTITFSQGTGTPPPPPTDSFDEWPLAFIDSQGGPGPGLMYPDAPLDGFVYTAHQVTWQAKRLKFRRLSAEPWEPWCALQTTYEMPGSPGAWTCNSGTSTKVTMPGKCEFTNGPGGRCTPSHLRMCSPAGGVCACNATGCGATTQRSSSFDITFFADGAVGSMDSNHLILMPAAP